MIEDAPSACHEFDVRNSGSWAVKHFLDAIKRYVDVKVKPGRHVEQSCPPCCFEVDVGQDKVCWWRINSVTGQKMGRGRYRGENFAHGSQQNWQVLWCTKVVNT